MKEEQLNLQRRQQLDFITGEGIAFSNLIFRQHPLDLSDRKAKTGMIKKLFVQGGGRDGAAAAEKFFKHYRPFEGEVKMGPPEERKWISDLQLKRSYIFSSTF